MLHDIESDYMCEFENEQAFDEVLLSLKQSTFLTRLKLNHIKFQNESILNQKLLGIIEHSPLRIIDLTILESEYSKIIIDIEKLS